MYYTYIMGNIAENVIYVGVTNDITRRVEEHKNKEGGVFTTRYNCSMLLYFEQFADVSDAIIFEKRLKGWSRQKKEDLIKTVNPKREDLSRYF